MSSESIGNDTKPPAAAAPTTFSLSTILNDGSENLEHPDFKDKAEGGWDEEVGTGATEGFCVECEGASYSDCIKCIRRQFLYQINPLSCTARIAVMTSARSVSPHSTGKALARATQPSP